METIGLALSLGLFVVSFLMLLITIRLLSKWVGKINETLEHQRKVVHLLREIRFNTMRRPINSEDESLVEVEQAV